MRHLRAYDLFEERRDEYGRLINRRTVHDIKDLTDAEIRSLIDGSTLEPDEASDIINFMLSNTWSEGGLKSIPPKVKLYRLLTLKNQKDFDEKEIGLHFVTDPNVIQDDYVLLIMDHAPNKNTYVATVEADGKDVDIHETLYHRLQWSEEKEITMLENSKMKVLSLDRYSEFKS